MIRALFYAAAVLALGVSAAAQHPIPAQLDGATLAPSQIDASVTQLIEAAHVTGAGIAIFHNGRIVYLKAYGFRDTEKKLPLTPDSVMTSASLSKAAFATVVMKLVQNGVLDLDKPVYQYLPKPLPDYPRYADLQGDDRYRKLTLRILLEPHHRLSQLARLRRRRQAQDPLRTRHALRLLGRRHRSRAICRRDGDRQVPHRAHARQPLRSIANDPHQHGMGAQLRERLRQWL